MSSEPRTIVMATRVSRRDRDLIEAFASAKEMTVSQVVSEFAVKGVRREFAELLKEMDEGVEEDD